MTDMVPGINGHLLIGYVTTILGVGLCFTGLFSRRGVYVARGALLLFIGGGALWWHGPGRQCEGRWQGEQGRQLRIALQERARVERSLYRDVLPLVAWCENRLAHIERARPAAFFQEQRYMAVEKDHVRTVLYETLVKKQEHEQALAELDAAIAGLERERALTQVKDVIRARAVARVTLNDFARQLKADVPIRSE